MLELQLADIALEGLKLSLKFLALRCRRRGFCGVSSMRQPHDRVTHSSNCTMLAGIRPAGRQLPGHSLLHCKDQGPRPASRPRDKPDARIDRPSKSSPPETPLEPMPSESPDLDSPTLSSLKRYSDRECGSAQAQPASGPQKTSVREPHTQHAGLDVPVIPDTSV